MKLYVPRSPPRYSESCALHSLIRAEIGWLWYVFRLFEIARLPGFKP